MAVWRARFSPHGALAPPYASEAEASRRLKPALQSILTGAVVTTSSLAL